MTRKEQVKFWLVPQLNHLELLHATYVNHSFTKHMHMGFAIGVIERGALAFSYRGENVVAPAGHINLVIPGEAHDGHGATCEGWTYRMFYLTPEVMEHAVYELSGKPKQLPVFIDGTIKDDYLAGLIRTLHILLEMNCLTLMEQESFLLTMLTAFILRHAEKQFVLNRIRTENKAIHKVQDYIEEMYRQNISIKTLSQLCNLSPFHLIRVFKNSVGVPPHVYLKQVRIHQAKNLLVKGKSPAFVAQEVGFSDQSHLSRQFKQITGITPSQYSNIVQAFSP